jgi:hypothetical protein
MVEPDVVERGWQGEGEVFTTLLEEGQWVLRRSIPEDQPIPLWLSHYCGDGELGAYSHRYDQNWDDEGTSWEIPCVKCASLVPKGMIALYKMLRWGGE